MSESFGDGYMVGSRKVIRFFLASPGDLQEERRAAKAVADEFNSLWADQLGYQVELVGWEDTVSGYGRPQGLINQDMERCEFFIGVLWKRWGSTPDHGGEFNSGFEEEFTLSRRAREQSGRPEISLFFKEVDRELLRDPGDDLKRVLAFRDVIIAEKSILFETFTDTSEFAEKVRRCITRHVQRLVVGDADSAPTSAKAQSASDDPGAAGSQNLARATHFLGVVASALSQSADEVIDAVQVARLQLVASVLATQSNDSRAVGVHDANIIFENRAEMSLDRAEINGLIRSGFEYIAAENAPLWHWVALVDGFQRSVLPVFTLFETPRRKVGALTAMRIIGERLPDDHESFQRATYVDSWLLDDQESVRIAALKYLAEFGIDADLPSIKAEVDRAHYQTANAAVDAYVRISLRVGREVGARALMLLQPDTIEPRTLSEIYKEPKTLSRQLLHDGLVHKNSLVRATSLRALSDLREIDDDAIERFLADSDARVRLQALLSLTGRGRRFSFSDARGHLVRRGAARRGLGLFGFTSGNEGDNELAQFVAAEPRSFSEKELNQALRAATVYDKDAYFESVSRRFATRSDVLRAAIDDRFDEVFEADLAQMEKDFGSADVIERTRALKESLRKEWTRKGVNLLCDKGGAQDLGRVRAVMASGFMAHSMSEVTYLGRFGEWQDIDFLLQYADRTGMLRGATLASSVSAETYRILAIALYRIGRTRLAELLRKEMPGRVRAHIVMTATDVGFRTLPTATLLWLLQADQGDVRRAAALKSVKTLSKVRLASLLSDHRTSDGTRYYNVIHWLDLGISAPRDRAVEAVHRAIEREQYD